MKSAVKKFLNSLLRFTYPRLYLIENNSAEIGYLTKNVANSEISDKAKISGPAQIGGCEIGDYSYIAGKSSIILTKIGKFCSIGPNFMCGFGVHPTNGLSTSPAFYSKNMQCGITFLKSIK